MRSSWVTPSAPRTTSARPQALASPMYSSRRRPRCSTTMAINSSPTTSAPTPSGTRLTPTLIQRWWPMARFAPRGQLEDGSSVWAKVHIRQRRGSFTPDKTAVAWLLLDKVGVEDGLTGGDILSKTTQVQRLSTTGGVAPEHGCDSLADVGHTAFLDYTADYFFYTDQ